MEATSSGGKIVDPLGERLKIMSGTAQSIAENDSKSRVFMGIFSLILGALAYRLKTAQAAKWREFVEQSNQ
ncbi:MAG: hypothetical protein HC805_05495 [Alkalinema sp. RL_2_19]|nr:hypothetical protein [Alkalinema sp. RL_2_19]